MHRNKAARRRVGKVRGKTMRLDPARKKLFEEAREIDKEIENKRARLDEIESRLRPKGVFDFEVKSLTEEEREIVGRVAKELTEKLKRKAELEKQLYGEPY